MAEFTAKSVIEIGSRAVLPTSVPSLTGFAFDGGEYVSERFFDVPFGKPDLLNARHVCEQLSSLFYQRNCPPKSQPALKKTQFVNHVLARLKFFVSRFVFSGHD